MDGIFFGVKKLVLIFFLGVKLAERLFWERKVLVSCSCLVTNG